MPGINNILQFAQSGGANVLTQEDYALLTSILSNGYPAGILDSNLLNKTLRQSNFIAVAVAQFIADQEIDVLDDGDVPALVLALTDAIVASISGTGIAMLDAVQTFTKAQRGDVVALVDGATITPDFSTSNNFSVTLGGNRTLASPTNLSEGQSGIIAVTHDGTGSRLLSFGAYWKFASGTAPTLSTGAGKVDYLTYYVETATRVFASIVKDVS